MARKPKKLTRKERMQQQGAVAQQRQAKGWVSPNEKAKQRQELVADMAPLIAMIEARPGAEEENLFMLLADSGDLAEEPEFREIFTEPLVTLPTYISVAEKLGLPTPDLLDALPQEEQEDKRFEILEETTRRLLNDELRQEVLEALNRLRLRLKKEGQRAEAARAAALQLTLNDRKSTTAWPLMGLIQAIVLRSLGAGFEMVGVTMGDEPDESADEEGSLADLYEKLNEPEVADKLSGAIKKVPGLRNYLEKQVDKIWDEGETAIFTGELYLNLFTDEELEAGAEMVKAVLVERAEAETAASEHFMQEKGKNLFEQVEAYLTERFSSPERLEQLRTRFQTLMAEADYPPEYSSFIKMLDETITQEATIQNEMAFLLKAFMGEMRAIVMAMEVAADEEPDED